MINAIKEYFENCPLVKGKIDVDILKEKDKSFSVEPVQIDPIVRTWIDGTVEKQFQFDFVSKFYWSNEKDVNAENSAFFEKLTKWINTQNDDCNYPNIEGVPTDISAMNNGALVGVTPDGKYGRYQMRIKLTYEE